MAMGSLSSAASRGWPEGALDKVCPSAAKRLKELEQENGKLKSLVAELSLDKQILQDIARGNF